MRQEFKGKNILVTGGTGSIGSEIVRQLIAHKPKVIRIFARHEDRHHALMHELEKHEKLLRFIIGDVRDKERLRLAMEGIDIVFHAAALKQVPLCEYNPFEAVKTNIIGTQNIIDVARELNIDKVIGISTDKAVDPESVLGVSKLMAEKLFLATYFYKGNKATKFSCVRFGNVLGSRGSILPLIKRQISGNRDVSITDAKMTRFVMTIPQAVKLVLDAVSLTRGQEVFILKMPAAQLSTLVEAAVEHYAPKFGKKAEDIGIKIIGRRNGEKQHEKALAGYEAERVWETKSMYILTPSEKSGNESYTQVYPGAVHKMNAKHASSEFAPKLSKKELSRIIEEIDSIQTS